MKLYGKEYLNLQEQVEKNKNDILQIKDLNKLGIKVVGKVETAEELPAVINYNIGEAFLVGEVGSYEMYVLTRRYPADEIGAWLNIGEIGYEGPQGPQGEPGPQGATGVSTRWWAYNRGQVPTTPTQAMNPGDMILERETGNVYYVRDANTIINIMSIKGPQGIQGIQGPQGEKGEQGEQGIQGPVGDPGSFIHIAGKVDTISQLPRPIDLQDLTIAYLVGPNSELYIQKGFTPNDAEWFNIGVLNVATYVTVNGQYVGMWDSDTKVDKINNTQNMIGLYGVGANSEDNTLYYTNINTVANTVPMRTSYGAVRTGTPTDITDAVNLGYAPVQLAKSEYEKSSNLLDKYNRDITRTTGTDWYYILDFTNVPNFNGNLTISTSQTIYQFVIYNIDGGDRYTQSGSYVNQWTFNLRTYTSNNKVLLRIIKGDATFDTINIMLNNGTTVLEYKPYNGRIIHANDTEPVLLWSNTSPTSAFDAQNINVNLSNYKYVIIKYRITTSNNTAFYVKINKSTTGNMQWILKNQMGNRDFICYNSYVQFSTGYLGTTSGNNSSCIPLEIYGTNVL